MSTNTYWSIITLKVNGLNAPVKRHRVEDWIKKKKCLQYSACTETQLRAKDTHRLKVRVWRKVFHANRNDKLMGGTILTLDKIDTDK